MKLFKENNLKNYLTQKLDRAKSDIQYMTEFEIAKISKEDLLAKLTKEATVKPLSVNLQDRTVKVMMIDVPAEIFPRTYNVYSGEKYSCARITYTYPSPNDSQLMGCAPSNYNSNLNVELSFSPKEMHVNYQTFYGNEKLSDDKKAEVKKWITSVHKEIENTTNIINDEIENYNSTISQSLEKVIDTKLQNITEKNKQNDDLNNF
ncbi:hypothetical protein [Flavobacterium sp. ZB4P13]|uniref:hypothetical protein n=1 Tax=Flavobacterium sp. ZB4P13 TaxID=3401728 RepID=UPI003AB07744